MAPSYHLREENESLRTPSCHCLEAVVETEVPQRKKVVTHISQPYHSVVVQSAEIGIPSKFRYFEE